MTLAASPIKPASAPNAHTPTTPSASARETRGVHAANASRSAMRRRSVNDGAGCEVFAAAAVSSTKTNVSKLGFCAGDEDPVSDTTCTVAADGAGGAAAVARTIDMPMPASGITRGRHQRGDPQRVARRRGQRQGSGCNEDERGEDAAKEDAREDRAERNADDRLDHYCCPLALSSSSRKRSSSSSSTASDSSRFSTSSRGEPSKNRDSTCVTTLRCASSRATTAL